MRHFKLKFIFQIGLLVLFGYLMFVSVLVNVEAQDSGILFHYKEHAGRTWGAWVTSDMNGDGNREIAICGAIYTKCLDLSGKELWDQWGLHHEVQWGCDSGIDANDDGATEQLVFEAVWNNHYLLDGKTGVALKGDYEEDRRNGLYWPIIDCGFGLDINVNGKGHNDYVITGIGQWEGVKPIVRCLESDNGSVIWEYQLTDMSNGVRPIMINGSQHILVMSNNMTVLTPYGVPLWSRMDSARSIAIIPNGSGEFSDTIVTTEGSDVRLINASNNSVIWSVVQDLATLEYCGDVNNDGIGDYGGLWKSGYKTGLFNGANGALIRNHSAQLLENYMHGITYCGDLNNDGYDDYGIYGDFALHEVFSGLDGTQLLAITGEDFNGAEEMYLVEDVNGNGVADIMLFDGGIAIIDGTTLGTVTLPKLGEGNINGFNSLCTLIGLLAISMWIIFEKNRSNPRAI